jgi:AcrR family transcriptional regulator
VDASTALFAERGYEATTMREIAKRADVPLSAFYYYFPRKHEVLVAIMDAVLEELDAGCAAVLEDVRPPDVQLAMMVRAHVLLHLRRPQAARIADGELRALERRARSAAIRRRDRYEARFREVLAGGKEAGVFAPDLDVAVAAMAILTMSTGAAAWWRPRGPLTAEDTALELGRFAVAVAKSSGRASLARGVAVR